MAFNNVKKDFYIRIINSIRFTGKLPPEKSRQAWHYYTKTLKLNGLIEYKDNSIWVLTKLASKLVDENSVKIPNLIPMVKPNTSIRKRNIASHGFGFRLKLPKIPNWHKRYNFFTEERYQKKILHTGVLRIIFDGCKTHIGQKSIVVHFPSGLTYQSESGAEGQRMAIEDFFKRIRKLEAIFGHELKIKKSYRFRIFRKHHAHVDNVVAKKCNIDGKSYQIRRDDGSIWLVIDFSEKVTHAETVNPDTATFDIDNKIKPLFDEVDRNPRFLTEMRREMQDILLLSHDQTKAIAELQKQNIMLTDIIQRRL